MKLKYKFVVRNIDGNPIAVTVGRDNAKYRSMIKLNNTGAFIFERLANETTVEAIAGDMVNEYGIPMDEAASAVAEFVDGMRSRGLIEE